MTINTSTSSKYIDVSHMFPTLQWPFKIEFNTLNDMLWYTYTSSLGNVHCVASVDNGIDTVEFCKGCNMDDDEILIWVLKYGTKLPRFGKQLANDGFHDEV